MRAIVVIPARLGSTRLARKPLLRETGKFLIEHVVERARAARSAALVVVATDSDEVARACASFGAEAVMTSPDHPSGTDRVAETARVLAARGERFDLVVNVQGDEPELPPANVDRLIALMEEGGADMGTLVEPLDDAREAALSQVVKVVLDAQGFALYFSRALIPHDVQPGPALRGVTSPSAQSPPPPGWLRHVGIYAFTPEFLQRFTALEPAPIERRERLEQLRALHHGFRIRAAIVPASGARGIDTPDDYSAFVARWRAGK
jgi:3-deoxy-manno-octulosonate cytidylyltransferase (CMP-KDO synthetase)